MIYSNPYFPGVPGISGHVLVVVGPTSQHFTLPPGDELEDTIVAVNLGPGAIFIAIGPGSDAIASPETGTQVSAGDYLTLPRGDAGFFAVQAPDSFAVVVAAVAKLPPTP